MSLMVSGFYFGPIVPSIFGIMRCVIVLYILVLLLLLLLLKNVGSERSRESEIHPISPKTSTPQPHNPPIDRKKRKGKRVEDNSRDSAA